MIKVSVLVPIYNVEKYIEKCIISIFEQTFTDIEYIFVNDCSQDNSMNILNQILDRYPLRKEQSTIINLFTNTGISNVRNILLSAANGEYIIFVDSDDWADKNYVETLYEKAKSKNYDIVGCNLVYEFESNTNYKYEFKLGNNKIRNLIDITSGKARTYLHIILTKKDIYKKNGILFSKNINVAEDFIVYCKLFYYANNISNVNIPLYHYYRCNTNSYTKLSKKNIIDRINSINEVEIFFKKNSIFNILKVPIEIRKFDTKKDLIVNKEFRDLKRWRYTFKESNYQWKYNKELGMRNRIACLFASKGFYFIAELFLHNK